MGPWVEVGLLRDFGSSRLVCGWLWARRVVEKGCSGLLFLLAGGGPALSALSRPSSGVHLGPLGVPGAPPVWAFGARFQVF